MEEKNQKVEEILKAAMEAALAASPAKDSDDEPEEVVRARIRFFVATITRAAQEVAFKTGISPRDGLMGMMQATATMVLHFSRPGAEEEVGAALAAQLVKLTSDPICVGTARKIKSARGF